MGNKMYCSVGLSYWILWLGWRAVIFIF